MSCKQDDIQVPHTLNILSSNRIREMVHACDWYNAPIAADIYFVEIMLQWLSRFYVLVLVLLD